MLPDLCKFAYNSDSWLDLILIKIIGCVLMQTLGVPADLNDTCHADWAPSQKLSDWSPPVKKRRLSSAPPKSPTPVISVYCQTDIERQPNTRRQTQDAATQCDNVTVSVSTQCAFQAKLTSRGTHLHLFYNSLSAKIASKFCQN